MSAFNLFKLASPLSRALEAMQFTTPTPIQSAAIPLALEGKDLIATAQTGTGKTAAFCLPIATQLLETPNSVALVITPTRELALQIDAFWKELTRFTPNLHSVCVIGGVGFQPQAKGLSRKPRLIIATPGRLCDHLQQRTANLMNVAFLVLDEADRMLDMGFAPQLNQILRVLPKKRQTLLFSATWEKQMDELSKKYLTAPSRVAVGSTSRAAGSIEQTVMTTSNQRKNETLLDCLNEREGSVLVFARTQARTDRLSKFLNSYGMEVGRIHGGRSQGQRNQALDAFKNGTTRILVATDIAARGIDVTEIAFVINYDLPQVAEDYIHRIGRTGRNGSTGQALTILIPEDRPQWKEITKLLQKTGSKLPTPIDEPVGIARPERKTENFHQPRPAFQKRPSHHFGGKPANPGRSRDNRDRDSRDPIGPNGGQPKKQHRKGPSQGRAPAPGGGGNRPAGFAKKRDPFKQRFQPRIQSTEPVNAY